MDKPTSKKPAEPGLWEQEDTCEKVIVRNMLDDPGTWRLRGFRENGTEVELSMLPGNWRKLTAEPTGEVERPVVELQNLQDAARRFQRGQASSLTQKMLCDYAASVLLATHAPPEVIEPADKRKTCTCTGTCRGRDGLGEGWRCALEVMPPDPIGNPTKYGLGVLEPKTYSNATAVDLESGSFDFETFKCPACEDGIIGADYFGEAIDCHCCDQRGRVSLTYFKERMDALACVAGDLQAAEFQQEQFRSELTALRAAGEVAKAAIERIRDSVLNERGPLAEENAGSDVINAVLAIIDDEQHAFAALSPAADEERAAITTKLNAIPAEDIQALVIEPPAEWLAEPSWDEPIPQRATPASPRQIAAQVKQAAKEIEAADEPIVVHGREVNVQSKWLGGDPPFVVTDGGCWGLDDDGQWSNRILKMKEFRTHEAATEFAKACADSSKRACGICKEPATTIYCGQCLDAMENP